MNVKELGQFIREQRTGARLTMRKLARATGVSVPYLSQIERGLRRPSADILQAIAKGLRLSAETMYVRAGILEERKNPDVRNALMKDPALTEKQRQTLIQIYEAFKAETTRERRRRRSQKVAHLKTGS
ncbi:MAG: helix-turn-helix domain-containing protein [Actinomycetota bacterium]|jgi:transcriptional regulator with XRE-family HTH domain